MFNTSSWTSSIIRLSPGRYLSLYCFISHTEIIFNHVSTGRNNPLAETTDSCSISALPIQQGTKMDPPLCDVNAVLLVHIIKIDKNTYLVSWGRFRWALPIPYIINYLSRFCSRFVRRWNAPQIRIFGASWLCLAWNVQSWRMKYITVYAYGVSINCIPTLGLVLLPTNFLSTNAEQTKTENSIAVGLDESNYSFMAEIRTNLTEVGVRRIRLCVEASAAGSNNYLVSSLI